MLKDKIINLFIIAKNPIEKGNAIINAGTENHQEWIKIIKIKFHLVIPNNLNTAKSYYFD